MAIRRMISSNPEDFRRFQADMIPLGRIRTGVYATPAGKRGRPEKLDRFRFTSPDRDLIEAVAAEYGGEARPWSPDKEPNRKEFEVITDTDELDVLIINGQQIDPTYEAWAAGRTCVRRCDGVWDAISQAPCLCNGPDKPKDPQKLCKITTRVRVMLRRVAGVGSWMYESHGEYFATETGGLMAELVARATVPVPSVLRLELERRREPDREKGGFKTKEFYVARFRTTAATPHQALTGGDTLAQALTGAPVRAIEAPQAGTERAATPIEAPSQPAAPDVEKLRPMILADIELQDTREGLDAIRTKLKSRGINDQRIIDAWLSKSRALEAAANIAEVRQMNEAAIASGLNAMREEDLADAVDALPPADRERLRTALAPEGRPYRVLVTGSRTWTDAEKLDEQLGIALMTHRGRMVLVSGACPTGADRLAEEWAERNGVPIERHPADWSQGMGAGFARNQAMVATFPDIVLSFNRGASKGTEHCTAAAEAAGLKVLRFTDGTPVEREAPKPVTGVENRVPDPRLDALLSGREFFADCLPQYDEAVQRGASHRDIVEAGGPLHWLATDDQNRAREVQPVDGTIEAAPGRVALPDVPAGDYDAEELYTMIMTGASQQNPPLTTSEVNRLITRTWGVDYVSQVGGYELARLRAGLKSGAVSWR